MRRAAAVLGLGALLASATVAALYAWVDRALSRMKW